MGVVLARGALAMAQPASPATSASPDTSQLAAPAPAHVPAPAPVLAPAPAPAPAPVPPPATSQLAAPASPPLAALKRGWPRGQIRGGMLGGGLGAVPISPVLITVAADWPLAAIRLGSLLGAGWAFATPAHGQVTPNGATFRLAPYARYLLRRALLDGVAIDFSAEVGLGVTGTRWSHGSLPHYAFDIGAGPIWEIRPGGANSWFVGLGVKVVGSPGKRQLLVTRVEPENAAGGAVVSSGNGKSATGVWPGLLVAIGGGW